MIRLTLYSDVIVAEEEKDGYGKERWME